MGRSALQGGSKGAAPPLPEKAASQRSCRASRPLLQEPSAPATSLGAARCHKAARPADGAACEARRLEPGARPPARPLMLRRGPCQPASRLPRPRPRPRALQGPQGLEAGLGSSSGFMRVYESAASLTACADMAFISSLELFADVSVVSPPPSARCPC